MRWELVVYSETDSPEPGRVLTVSPMRVLKVREVLGLDHQVAPPGSPVRRSNNAVTKGGEVNAEWICIAKR